MDLLYFVSISTSSVTKCIQRVMGFAVITIAVLKIAITSSVFAFKESMIQL